jgi:thiamine pyrophosphate-dependent acetolactate synthase large subunit-like protein
VNTPEQLRPVLERALGESGATLIEIPVDDRNQPSPWEFLMPTMK